MTFDDWYEVKGWWLARRLNLPEEVIKEIWEEGYNIGESNARYRDGWSESE